MTLRRIALFAREEIGWRLLRRSRVVRYGLAALAFAWRRMMVRTTFIAITGSLGKTTTKECLAAILAAGARTVKTHHNRNGGAGLCLTILRVRPWHRYAVLEVAGAAPDMMRRAAWLVRPDVAIVLNVLRTHTTAFRDLEQHAAEKSRLVEALGSGGLAVLNGDEPRVAAMASRARCQVRFFGTSPSLDLWADGVDACWPQRLTFQAHAGTIVQTVVTQLVGTHWLPAVLASLTAARECGVSLSDAAAALPYVEPFPARLRPLRLPGGAIVLRDDYNASVDALDAALRVMENARAARRVLVITDFSDSGMNRKNRLRQLAAAAARAAEVVVFVGENAAYGRRRAIDGGVAPSNAHEFPTLGAAARFLEAELRSDDLVLLKGRTTDHAARLFFAQLGPVGCWKVTCPKRMLCDSCWRLTTSITDIGRARLARPEPVPHLAR
jgi:UDP-N-acetylmuramoyl-tripeptide--D-alanyl-D-alanine ligase